MSTTANKATMNAVQIQCCLCGTMIYPNGANQCSSCLAQQVDLRSVLQKGPSGGDIVIHQCRQCRRFQRTEKNYIDVELESPELMTICLKHIPALSSSSSGMQLMDAIWVWTEPNSMRMKVRLTVRTEISSVRIQQRCVVELIVKFQQCPDCNREYTNRTWHALVQLRQRRDQDASKTGLTVLEMALARNPAIRKHVLSMDTTKQGFDFYFLSLAHAQQFSSYLARVAPLKLKTTQKLVSADVKNNTANVKYTVAADMVPLCRDDLLLVHKSVRTNSGSLSLVTKMSSVVHLVDASPKRNIAVMKDATAEVAPETYYKHGADKMYMILASARRLTRFVVLDIELCHQDSGHKQYDNDDDTPRLYQGPQSGIDKYALADVEVVRESDFGQNDETLQCVTHLGHLLQPGDVVLGYDLATFVVSGGSEWEMEHWLPHSFHMPDVVLVKKVQGGAAAAPEEDEAPKKIAAKSSRAKKRAKRQQREEKKMRALEDAAERMGFMETSNNNNFEEELTNDPDLAEELRAAELALAKEEDNVPPEQDEKTPIIDVQDGVVSEP